MTGDFRLKGAATVGNLLTLSGLIDLFFRLLMLALIVRVILMWIVSFSIMSPGNPIVVFFNRMTDPILAPIAKRIPRTSFMVIDLSLWISLLFCLWALNLLDALVQSSLPANW
ncbi:MAG: YggT family protein [Ktedonobacterales bacterium]